MKKLKLIFLITLFTLASNVSWAGQKPHLYHKSPTVYFTDLINCHNTIVTYNNVNCSRILVEWMDSVNGEPNWSRASQQAMFDNLGVSKKELKGAMQTVARGYLRLEIGYLLGQAETEIKQIFRTNVTKKVKTIVYEQPSYPPSAGYYNGCLKKKITYNQCRILYTKWKQTGINELDPRFGTDKQTKILGKHIGYQ